MKRILLLITIAIYGFSALQAQITCTEQLTNAQRSFDDGLLDDIPMLVADCMEDGFTKEEKANAYKLLIQTYLFTEEIEKADELMIQFLTEFPSYSIAVNDPREFIDLYNTYRTAPIFKLEFLLSGTLNTPVFLKFPGVTDNNSDLNEYSPAVGIYLQANYVNTLVGDFDYSAGLSFAYSTLGYYNEPTTYSKVEATLKSMTVGVPMAARYNFSWKGIDMYAKAGIEPVYLLSYKADMTRTDLQRSEPIQELVDRINYHNRFDLRPFLGVGAKINLGRDQIHISLGYTFGMINPSPESNRYGDFSRLSKFFTLEPEMLANNPTLSVSYFRSIYKPLKIR